MELANFVRYNEVLLYRGSFLYTYFTITGVNKSVRYTEDFHYNNFIEGSTLIVKWRLLTNFRVIGSVVKPCC